VTISRISRAEYDKLDAVNWSTLKHMLRSPAHYRAAMLEKPEDTPALKMGRLIHIAAFEPERWKSEVAVWDGGRRQGKEWERFQEDHRGLELATSDEAELALAVGEAARVAAGTLMAKGKREMTLQWKHKNGLAARGRIDFLSEQHGIVDLKSTADASPEGFGRAAARFEYCTQAAYYVDGIEAITGKRVGYVLVAIEKKKPFVPGIYPLTEDHLELGRSIYLPLLDRLKRCIDEHDFPGYPSGPLSLPLWAVPNDNDDGAGLDWSE
jgi:hypothetical protein